MSTVRIVAWAALGLLVLSGSAFALSEIFHRSTRERTTVADPVTRIVINADVGDVEVRAGLTPNVVVARHDSWVVNQPKVDQRFADGTLTIATTCGRLTSVLRCRSDLRIDAPPEVDIVIRSDVGDVDLRGLNGRADVQTASGDIRAHRLNPVIVRAHTDAGDVALDLVGEPTRTEARSDGGDIEIVVPYGPYRVDATADAGDVTVAGVIRDDLAPQAISAMTDAGDVTVRAR